MLGAGETAMAESKIIFNVDESLEGGFEARALGYSIYTEAETMDELRAIVQDAVRCHFDAPERPGIIRLLSVPPSPPSHLQLPDGDSFASDAFAANSRCSCAEGCLPGQDCRERLP